MGFLNEQQRSLIMDWLRQGYNPYECVRHAEQQGFSVTQQTIQGRKSGLNGKKLFSTMKNHRHGLINLSGLE